MPFAAFLFSNVQWMAWNTLLACMPFVLSLVLFKPKTKTTPLWYLSALIFFIFLPNAPYIFTDIIHLYSASFKLPSNVQLYAVTVQYIVFLLIGALLFVFSYRNFESFMVKKYKMHILVFRTLSFLLISIGIYLGRFLRFNSWDIILRPIAVLQSLTALFTLHAVIYIAGFIALLFGIDIFFGRLQILSVKRRSLGK